MFTSLQDRINIAAASQFPLARRLLSSYLPFLCCHPHCLKEQSTDTACHCKNIYSLSIGWTQRPFSCSNIQTNHMHLLTAPHAYTHLFTVGIPPILTCPSGTCLWLIWKLVEKNKHSSKSSHPTLPAAENECGVRVCSSHPRTHPSDSIPLTPSWHLFLCSLYPSFVFFLPCLPLSLSLSYLNLSPYILPLVLLNLFLVASFLLTNFRSGFSN